VPPREQKRTIENKVPPHVPLDIKIRKEKEEKIRNSANKTWYRDVEINITNTSEKPIYYFALFLEMPEIKSERGATMVFEIHFGRAEFVDFSVRPLPDDKPLLPGETYTYEIPVKLRIAWENSTKANNKADAMKLEIQFNHISFGDGTGFASRRAVPIPPKTRLYRTGSLRR
jgi:hypothetical protein